MLIAAGAAAAYYYWFASPIDAEAAQELMATLRGSQSLQEGLTVDEQMNQYLANGRKAGTLVKYKGWFVKPSDIRTELVIGFSYEDSVSGEQRAEWVVNTRTRIFKPLTPLAAEVYGG